MRFESDELLTMAHHDQFGYLPKRRSIDTLIGRIRRECLDHMIVFGEAHLRGILGEFASYYNKVRVHRSLDMDAPVHRRIENLGDVRSRPVLGGLHHQYWRT